MNIKEQFELWNDLDVFEKTGDIPNNNDFLANKVRQALEKNNNPKWQEVKQLDLTKLSRETLGYILDDLTGFKFFPAYKIKELICQNSKNNQ